MNYYFDNDKSSFSPLRVVHYVRIKSDVAAVGSSGSGPVHLSNLQVSSGGPDTP